MLTVVALHAVGALVSGLFGRRLRRRVLLLGAVPPAVALAVTVARTATDAHAVWQQELSWLDELGLTVGLRLDGFGLLFWWLIAGIGVLVFLYAYRYFGDRDDLGLFTAMLVTFAGSMLLLVAADNVLLVYVAWEATSVTSYLLIGFADRDAAARAGALQALLITAAGGLALLGGLILLAEEAGTYSLAAMLADLPTGTSAQIGLALVLVGAFAKSAQVPLHFWLPGAMAAPTPVSAYLHSATMVKAGVYLVARFAPAAAVVDWWQPVVLGVGGATMLLGGWRALRSTDLKSLLAFGTISQLGFMTVLLGAGETTLTHAGVAVVLAHALFKAALFMVVGVVDHQAGTRDLRRLDGLAARMPVTTVTAVVAASSMVGMFPLLGFVAKEAALEAGLEGALHTAAARPLLLVVIVLGSALTAAYAVRLLWGTFGRKAADVRHRDMVDMAAVPRPARALEAPALLLATMTLVLGVWVAPADSLVSAGAMALDPLTKPLHLAAWHGLGPALLLSVLAIGLGLALYASPRLVERVGRWTAKVPDMTGMYRRALHGLNRSADLVTGLVQPGSLPTYAGVVLATLLVLPGWAVVRGFALPDELVFADHPIQVVAAAAVLVSGLAAVRMRRRVSAVLALGGVGVAVAVLFIAQGAPDVALTQLLVETLILALFVVVLRRLPERFDVVPWRLGHSLRVGIAAGVGLFAGAFSLWAATGGRTGTPKEEFLARALPEGGGRNVVNVILTDFRGFDTLGEITVLLVAAVGVAALVRTSGPDVDPDVDPDVGPDVGPDGGLVEEHR